MTARQRVPTKLRPGRWSALCAAAIALLSVVALPAQKPSPRPADETRREAEERRRQERARHRELAIRAQFLRHFCSYVGWPEERFADDESSFVLGVVGDDPFGRLLEKTFDDKRVHGRRVRIRRAGGYADLDAEGRAALRACHALVVAESDRAVQGRLIESLDEHGVLLIAHEPGFAAAGGHIQTFVSDNKVRFEINQKALETGELTCRAALLKLSSRGPRPDPEPDREQPPSESRSSRSGHQPPRRSGHR